MSSLEISLIEQLRANIAYAVFQMRETDDFCLQRRTITWSTRLASDVIVLLIITQHQLCYACISETQKARKLKQKHQTDKNSSDQKKKAKWEDFFK